MLVAALKRGGRKGGKFCSCSAILRKEKERERERGSGAMQGQPACVVSQHVGMLPSKPNHLGILHIKHL